MSVYMLFYECVYVCLTCNRMVMISACIQGKHLEIFTIWLYLLGVLNSQFRLRKTCVGVIGYYMVNNCYKCLQIMIMICTAIPEETKLDLLLITIATEPTDGYVRFMRTAERYGYNVKVNLLSIYQ